MKKTDCRTMGRFAAVCSAGALAMSVACAALGQTCIISGTLERTAADSESSSPVSAFDSVAIDGASSAAVAVFDSVSFAASASTGGNLNSRSPALMIILR